MSAPEQRPTRRCRVCPAELTPDNTYASWPTICKRCHKRVTLDGRLRRRDSDPDYRRACGRRHHERRKRFPGDPDKRGTPYTNTEIAILLDGSISHAEASRITGRSLGSVQTTRRNLVHRFGLPQSVRGHAANRRGQPAHRPEPGKGAA